MKQYIKSDINTLLNGGYSRETVIEELRKIPGIKIVFVQDEYVVCKDHNGKEYSIDWEFEKPEQIDALFEQLKANANGFSYTTPQDLSRERLELIVSSVVDIINKPELGSYQQLSKIITLLEYYNLR